MKSRTPKYERRSAPSLNIPKSTVSRRVSRLEDELGVDLLHRTTRAIQLSNDGRALYARLEPLLSEVDGALQELSQRNETVSGCLRLTTTPAFGQSSTVVDCLATFGLKHPEISIDISLGQRVVDLVEEGFDVALRLHQHELPGRSSNMARHLFDFKWGFYASAQLLTTIKQSRKFITSTDNVLLCIRASTSNMRIGHEKVKPWKKHRRFLLQSGA